MKSELNPEVQSTPEQDVQKVPQFIFGIVCVLVIGVVVWFADPRSSFEPNAEARDSPYNLLVRAFGAGHLYLDKPVPTGLAKLADPYDPALNAPYLPGVVDLSYYHTRFYLYFGITPVLLYGPYAALTGHYLSDRAAVIIFFSMGFLAFAGLVRGIWRRYLAGANIWLAGAGVFALGLAIALTFWCNTNEAARTCGFAFIMLALGGIWRAMHEPGRRILWLSLSSLAYGLAIGARPSLLFGAVILLIPVAWDWRQLSVSEVSRMFAAAVGPLLLVGLGLMLYNDRRFGSPFEFGWHYQLLDYRATTTQQFSLHYLWSNVRYYFLAPVQWTSHFPFLQSIPIPSRPSGYFSQAPDPQGGILINYPLVLLALAVPFAWRGRPMRETMGLRWFVGAVFLLFVICAVTLCLFFAAGKSYELDFLPSLLLLSVIGFLGLERALAHLPMWRRMARVGWCLLLVYAVGFNLLLNIESHSEAMCLRGNAALADGRFDDAGVQFQKALALWPDSASALDGLGSALLKQGNLDEAIAQYQKALEIKPDFAEAHNNLGYCFLQKGQVDDAITQYQKAVELRPDSAEFHNVLGNALFQKGQIDPAITQYQAALALKSDFAETYYNLGYCYFQKGQVDDAIAQYQKAVELRPESGTYQNALASALFQKGQIIQAIIHYQKALEIKPDFAEARYNLGYCFLQTGRTDDAIAQFQKAIEAQPDFPQAYDRLGDAFERKGMAAEAKAARQKAAELALPPK
jgi:tetratricopeptide (TPR) repeat protein